jgi:hypothetical protein
VLKALKYKNKSLMDTLQTKGELSADSEAELRAALDDFRSHRKAE